MKGLIPFASITVTAGAATQALSTSAALLALFDDAGGANGPSGTNDDGINSVQPDKANNRMKLMAPGVFKVTVMLSGVVDGAADITISLAKNATEIADTKSTQRWGTTENSHTLTAIVVIASSDNPGTLADQAEPSGTFTGGGGYPKNMVPLTVLLTAGTGTPTVTLKKAQWIVERIG